MTALEPSPQSETSRPLVAMLGLCTIVLVIWALSAAKSVFAPLAFAVFVMAIAWPLQRRLQAYMPRLLALALTMVMTILLIIVFASLIAWASTRVARFVASDAARLQALYGPMAAWLESHGVEIAGVWASYFNVDQLIRVAQGGRSRAAHLSKAVVGGAIRNVSAGPTAEVRTAPFIGVAADLQPAGPNLHKIFV